MVRYTRKADRAEKDRVELFELFDPVLRHHTSGFGISLTAPIKALPLKTDIEASARRLQRPHTLGHNLLANAISRDSGDFVCAHGHSLCIIWKVCEFNPASSVAPLTDARAQWGALPFVTAG
jgi:hypothetical protein